MLPNFDFTGLFVFAMIGLLACALALFVGVPWLIWFLAHHIAFV